MQAARLLEELGRHEEADERWRVLWNRHERDLEVTFHRASSLVRHGKKLDRALGDACSGSGVRHRDRVRRQIESPPCDGDQLDGLRHVAIAGVSYCGSTLLDRLLGSLPATRSIGESHWLIKSYRDRQAAPLDFDDPDLSGIPNCTVCGRGCEALSLDFRAGLAADRSNWYFKIARRLGTEVLVSADKNAPKLVDNDPLLRMDVVVLFKSPQMAWMSQLAKLPSGHEESFYLEEIERYMDTWSRAYRLVLDNLRPQGRKVALWFDGFTINPARHLAELCRALDLEHDPRVLQRAVPGHAIGGNDRAMQRLRDDGYRVRVLPLPPLDLVREHLRRIEGHGEVQATFAELLERYEHDLGIDVASLAPRVDESRRLACTPGAGSNGQSPSGSGPLRPVRAVLQPFPVPRVDLRYQDGMFGDLHDGLHRRITELRETGGRRASAAIALFEQLMRDVGADQYAEVQRRYLAAARESSDPTTLKFLDIGHWMEGKLSRALQLGLDRREPMEILDLGTGPGHFPYIASFFGHRALGTEVPLRAWAPGIDRHLYDELCRLLGVERIQHVVRQLEPFPDFGARFDLVTTFMAAFSVDEDGAPWTTDAWAFFLREVGGTLLKPGGELYLNLTRNKLTEASWRYLVERATTVYSHPRTVLITRFPDVPVAQ